jgi:hypothetical protein
VLDGGSEEERAELIAQRLREWKSAANAFLNNTPNPPPESPTTTTLAP